MPKPMELQWSEGLQDPVSDIAAFTSPPDLSAEPWSTHSGSFAGLHWEGLRRETLPEISLHALRPTLGPHCAVATPPTTSRVLTAGSLPQPEPLVSPGSFHNPCYPCYIPGDCTAGLYPLGEPETDADSATAKGMCEQAGLSSATLALPATTDSSLTSASVRLLSLGLCGNTCAFGK